MNSIIVDKNNPKTKQELFISNIIIEIPFFYHYFVPSVGGGAAAPYTHLIIQDIDEDVEFYSNNDNNNMELVELQPFPTHCEGAHLYTYFLRECMPNIGDQYNYLLHSFTILTDLGIVYLSDNITIQNTTHLPLLTNFHHSLYAADINNIDDLVEKINLIDDTNNYLWPCDLMLIVLAIRGGGAAGAAIFIENVCLKFITTNLFIRNLDDKKQVKDVYNSLVKHYLSLFDNKNNKKDKTDKNILGVLFDIFKKNWKKWNKFTLHVCFGNILQSFDNAAVDKLGGFQFNKKIQNFIFECCFL